MGQSTEQFAARWHIKPASVISRLCRKGHYFGVTPHKLENGRLDWPDELMLAEAAPAATNERTNRATA